MSPSAKKPTPFVGLSPPQAPTQTITHEIFQPVVQPTPSRPPPSNPPLAQDPSKLPASCQPQEGPGKPLVWLITGATGLLGKCIVQSALAKGDSVVAVSREIMDHVTKEREKAPSTKLWTHERCLAIRCDVRLKSQVEAAVKNTQEQFGRLDIVCNCAGWGILGACEEQTDFELRSQFETNVYGTFNVVRQTLSLLRDRESGRYINLTSTTGILGVPGLGPYCATKWAIEGLTESLSQELEGFSCKATIVEIGNVHRAHNPSTPDKLGHLILKSPTIKDYIGTPVDHSKKMMIGLANHQPTSPQKAGAMIWELAHCGNPPVRLLLGSHAVDTMRDKLRHSVEEIENWQAVSSLEQL